jgi:hypothetical protein
MSGPDCLSAAGSRDLRHYYARTVRTSSSANNACPSATNSGTSKRSQAHDTVRHIEVANDLLTD